MQGKKGSKKISRGEIVLQNTNSLQDILPLLSKELEESLAAELDAYYGLPHHFSHRYQIRKQHILQGQFQQISNSSYRRRLIILFAAMLALLTSI